MATQRDFNGDGTTDLLFVEESWIIDTSAPRADWFIRDGTYAGGGNIGPSTSGSFFTPLTGDFNGDGTTDLLLSSGARNDGFTGGATLTDWFIQNGTYAGATTIGTIPSGWSLKSAGDFNGDGTSDLLFKSDSGDLATWFIHDGTYAGGTNIGTIPTGWNLIGTGDFNGDGTKDPLFQSSAGLLATWFIHDGAYAGGANIGALPFPPSLESAWALRSAGDYNGDGTTDLLFENSSGILATWFIHDGAYAGGTNIGAIPSGWSLRGGSGDFNGDGTSDLLFKNDNSGALATWFIHNGAYAGGTNIGTIPSGWHMVAPNASNFLVTA